MTYSMHEVLPVRIGTDQAGEIRFYPGRSQAQFTAFSVVGEVGSYKTFDDAWDAVVGSYQASGGPAHK